ncbi:hypothetical protein ACFY2W_22400 [Streptomyces sp. NPDC001262]
MSEQIAFDLSDLPVEEIAVAAPAEAEAADQKFCGGLCAWCGK